MKFDDFLVEHNVFNLKDLDQWLTGFTMELSTEAGKNWFSKTLKKQIVNAENPADWLQLVKGVSPSDPDWARAAAKRGELYSFEPRKVPETTKEEIEHIGDYVRWLEDNSGENVEAARELNKLGKQSFEIMSAKTDQWVVTINRQAMKKEKQRLKDTGVSEEPGVNIEMKWSDGWFIAQLMTAEACSREGALSGHCIGSYGSRIGKGDIELYSLRDPNNKPQVSMEVKKNELWQIKGNHNKPPGPEHIPYIKDFVLARNFDIRGDYKNLGLIKLGDKLWDPEKEMPEVVEGNLFLSQFPGALNFPKKFVVKGSMYLESTQTVGDFPQDLEVTDDLDIERSNVSILPARLIVGQSLHLSHTKITKLPEGISVGHDLNVSHTKIKRLPKEMTIGGGLDLEDSLINELPEGLVIQDYLDISQCKELTKLPTNMSIGGNLYIGDTVFTTRQVKAMKGIRIGGTIDTGTS